MQHEPHEMKSQKSVKMADILSQGDNNFEKDHFKKKKNQRPYLCMVSTQDNAALPFYVKRLSPPRYTFFYRFSRFCFGQFQLHCQ
jgi:hypothetical protein